MRTGIFIHRSSSPPARGLSTAAAKARESYQPRAARDRDVRRIDARTCLGPPADAMGEGERIARPRLRRRYALTTRMPRRRSRPATRSSDRAPRSWPVTRASWFRFRCRLRTDGEIRQRSSRYDGGAGSPCGREIVKVPPGARSRLIAGRDGAHGGEESPRARRREAYTCARDGSGAAGRPDRGRVASRPGSARRPATSTLPPSSNRLRPRGPADVSSPRRPPPSRDSMPRFPPAAPRAVSPSRSRRRAGSPRHSATWPASSADRIPRSPAPTCW